MNPGGQLAPALRQLGHVRGRGQEQQLGQKGFKSLDSQKESFLSNVATRMANEAVYAMVIGAAAKSIFCCCCSYITKHSAQLATVLSLMYDAKEHVDHHKSI
jgi:hypothetical protein